MNARRRASERSTKNDSTEDREYSSHRDQLLGCSPSLERVANLERALLEAYKNVLEYRKVPFIRFGDLDAQELAKVFHAHPVVIKPTLCCVNVAGRAIQRDLGISLNTYSKKISQEHATLLAGYIKPMLPPMIAIPALMELDRFFWTDKEMRAKKGNWERTITEAINAVATGIFYKRRFECDGEKFELDAASPTTGKIKIGVDVKRIESPRDIHKRADEIINKAVKFKRAFPKGKFVAFVYYPFPTQHINLQSRLSSTHIDGLFFAGQTPSSVATAIDLMVSKLGIKKS
jgi:hypothetical protein